MMCLQINKHRSPCPQNSFERDCLCGRGVLSLLSGPFQVDWRTIEHELALELRSW